MVIWMGDKKPFFCMSCRTASARSSACFLHFGDSFVADRETDWPTNDCHGECCPNCVAIPEDDSVRSECRERSNGGWRRFRSNSATRRFLSWTSSGAPFKSASIIGNICCLMSCKRVVTTFSSTMDFVTPPSTSYTQGPHATTLVT